MTNVHSTLPAGRMRACLAPLAIAFALVASAPQARSQCQTNQNCWPPPGVTCAYPAPGAVFYPGTTAGVRNVELREPNACAPYPPQGGAPIQSFFDVFVDIELTLDNGGNWSPSTVTAPCVVRISPPPTAPPNQTFQTEMLSMSLTSGGVMIRESPTLPSQGQTTKQDLGGGLYRIDSFFDVFTELSLDGGQSWHPASQTMHVTTIDRNPTPTRAGTWGTVKILYR